MEIRNNVSPSFGSIQVGISKMSLKQHDICERLFSTLKYNEKYSKMSYSDLDIYMLPKSNKGVEIRFMDPYSGNFVRGEKNNILKLNIYSTLHERVGEVTDKVVDIYERIVNGIIARPKENMRALIDGETDVSRINPAKTKSLHSGIKFWEREGYPKNEAEEQAFEQYKELYHINNRDADF